jgi:hypothetical protein
MHISVLETHVRAGEQISFTTNSCLKGSVYPVYSPGPLGLGNWVYFEFLHQAGQANRAVRSVI